MTRSTGGTPGLRSDCSSCFGLCCVLLPFSADSGFGVDKPGGRPCLNLLDDDRCRIHATLREDGWPGCTVFECFGAGQQVSQVTYAGVSWRETATSARWAPCSSVMRQLHEMLVHLDEVERRSPDPDGAAAARPDRGADRRRSRDAAHRRRRRASTSTSAACSPTPARAYAVAGPMRATSPVRTWPGSDVAGDLRGCSLRGALLIGADLREPT